jgi:hypothetical protein
VGGVYRPQDGATAASDAAFLQDTNRVLVDPRDADLALSADDLERLPAAISDALAECNLAVRAFSVRLGRRSEKVARRGLRLAASRSRPHGCESLDPP